jgi:hypothetical protein
MDIIAAYREAGTFHGAAEIAGTTHKTVRRVIARHEVGGAAPGRCRAVITMTAGPSWWRRGGEDDGPDFGEAAVLSPGRTSMGLCGFTRDQSGAVLGVGLAGGCSARSPRGLA